MPSNDPKFVRLANRLALQMVADVTGGSGWSIAGMDVKEFPEDEEQAAYVRVQLGRGVLEVATQAEYDEVQEEEEAAEVVARFSDPTKPKPWQEAEVQAVHAKKRRSLEENRESDEDELSEEEEDEIRRQEIADEQEELGLNTDDPEEQVSRVRSGGVRAKKAAAAKKASRRQRQSSSSSTPSSSGSSE